MLRDYSDILKYSKRRSRARSLAKISTSGLIIGVLAGGLFVYISALPIFSAIIVVIIITVAVGGSASAMGLACFGSWWRLGSALIGGSLGFIAAHIFSQPLEYGLVMGIALGASVTAQLFEKVVWFVGALVNFPLLILGLPHGQAFWSARLGIIAYKEAVISGDPKWIFETGNRLHSALARCGRSSEMLLLGHPLYSLACTYGNPGYIVNASTIYVHGLVYQGQFSEAKSILKKVYQDVHKLWETELGNRKTTAAKSIYSSSVNYQNQDFRQSHWYGILAMLTNNMMAVYQETGDFDIAYKYGLESLRYSRMELHHHKKYSQSPLTVTPPTLVMVYLNLADLLLENGTDDYDEVRLYLDEAYRLLKGQEKFNWEEFGLFYLFDVKHKLISGTLSDAKEAILKLEETISHFQNQDHKKMEAEAHFWQAVIRFHENDIQECRLFLEEANKVNNEVLAAVFPVCSDEAKLTFVKTIRRHSDAYLWFTYNNDRLNPDMLEYAYELSLLRKGLSSDVQLARKIAILIGRYPKHKGLLEEHKAILYRIANLIQQSPIGGNALNELENRRRQIEVQLSQSIPEIQLAKLADKGKFQSIAAAIDENTMLVEYVYLDPTNFETAFRTPIWGGPVYVAFVIKGGKSPAIRMEYLGSAKEINNLVKLFLEKLHSPFVMGSSTIKATSIKPVEETLDPPSELDLIAYREYGYALYQKIFAPILSENNTVDYMFIAPDSDLSLIPFEVFLTENGVIDDNSQIELSYLSTGRDLLRHTFRANISSSTPIVISNPDFDLRDPVSSSTTNELIYSYPCYQDINFPLLNSVKDEGQEISRLLDINLWGNENALKGKLKQCKSPRILHISSHGYFLPDDQNEGEKCKLMNPLLASGIALAGANTCIRGEPCLEEAEDGLLTAEDINGLDLLGTDLVVLSACETGLGKVFAGEGVFGLRRAVINAGAKTLVISLWKVPELATQKLMVAFYQYLVQGHSCIQALQNAKLDIKKQYPHPFFWAGFICQGNPSLRIKFDQLTEN